MQTYGWLPGTVSVRSSAAASQLGDLHLYHISGLARRSGIIQKGHKVAICEQLESPEAAKQRGAKGPLRRDVVRIVTSGTLTEEGLLPTKTYNFLIALSPLVKETIGVAAVDVSTGFFSVESTTIKNLANVLSRLEPAEIVLPDSLLQCPDLFETFAVWKKQLSPIPQARFDLENARHRLENLYQVKTLQAFGTLKDTELQAAGAIIDYLHITQKQQLHHIHECGYPFPSGSFQPILQPTTV